MQARVCTCARKIPARMPRRAPGLRPHIPAGFFYSNAEQREKLVAAEREVTDERVRKVIELKRKVRAGHGVKKKGGRGGFGWCGRRVLGCVRAER